MKQLITLCLLFISISIQATVTNSLNTEPKTGSVSGRVLDATLNEPLPYVNVIIKNTAGETITGGITLDDGNFKVDKIPEGTAIVSIQYLSLIHI